MLAAGDGVGRARRSTAGVPAQRLDTSTGPVAKARPRSVSATGKGKSWDPAPPAEKGRKPSPQKTANSAPLPRARISVPVKKGRTAKPWLPSPASDGSSDVGSDAEEQQKRFKYDANDDGIKDATEFENVLRSKEDSIQYACGFRPSMLCNVSNRAHRRGVFSLKGPEPSPTGSSPKGWYDSPKGGDRDFGIMFTDDRYGDGEFGGWDYDNDMMFGSLGGLPFDLRDPLDFGAPQFPPPPFPMGGLSGANAEDAKPNEKNKRKKSTAAAPATAKKARRPAAPAIKAPGSFAKDDKTKSDQKGQGKKKTKRDTAAGGKALADDNRPGIPPSSGPGGLSNSNNNHNNNNSRDFQRRACVLAAKVNMGPALDSGEQ